MPGQSSNVVDSTSPQPCPICSALPLNSSDQFCRRCGYRISLECRHCHAKIRPMDRYCSQCGCRRMIIFDQIKKAIVINSPVIIAATAILAAGAWLSLRYALRNKL